MKSLSTVTLVVLAGAVFVTAQTAPPGQLPADIHSGSALQTVPDTWMWHMGMLRGLYEVDGVAALEIKKATGTVRVDGQTHACELPREHQLLAARTARAVRLHDSGRPDAQSDRGGQRPIRVG